MLARFGIAVVALVGLTAFAPAPQVRAPRPGDLRAALKKLEGTWERRTLSSRKAKGGARGGFGGRAGVTTSTTQVRIQGDRWTTLRTSRGEARPTATYKMVLNAAKDPMWLDLVPEVGDLPTMSGIVKVEGDTVTFCYTTAASEGIPRPAAFERGENHLIMTLKRVAP